MTLVTLYALGIRENTLSEEEKLKLDTDGFLPLPNLVPYEQDPQEIKLIGAAGTVVIFNSHLWHGATLNRSSADRPNVTSFWCRREGPLMNNSSDWGLLSPGAFARLSEAARCLFIAP